MSGGKDDRSTKALGLNCQIFAYFFAFFAPLRATLCCAQRRKERKEIHKGTQWSTTKGQHEMGNLQGQPQVTSLAPQFLVDDLARSMSYYRKLGFTFGTP